MNNSKHLLALAISAALAAPMTANATNGMALEGYGPIASGMGGASMAYDNGTAAMMNNPATLSMMDEGSRFDLALGVMSPTVEASVPSMGMEWDSTAGDFYMPALGWTKSNGDMTYGVGMFAQGGMGTLYDGGVLSGMVAGGGAGVSAMGSTPDAPTAATISGWDEMSEVGVMRILAPFSKQVNDKLNVGGSIDFVKAGMDLQMVMSGAMMMDMMPGGSQSGGTLTGSMIDAMAGMMGPGGIEDLYGGQFDFADGSPYTGATEGTGFAGKLGFTYQATPKLTIGGTYHTKTAISDLKGDATVSMAVRMDPDGVGPAPVMDLVMPINGTISVNDFQWPATLALGVSFKASDKLMLVADVKQLSWADAMKNFSMTFTAKDTAFAGTKMDAKMYQDWKDQTVIQLGGAYAVNDATTLRAGYSDASNPIPNSTMHYLFPAITETAYTLGLGYQVNNSSSIDVAYNYVVNKNAGDMIEVDMSQNNYQLMYSYKF